MSCFNLFVVHLGVVLVCLLFLFHCVFSLAISFLFTVVCKWSVSLLLSFFDYLLLLMYFVAFVSKVFLSSSVGVFFFLGCRFPPFFFNVFYLHCRLLCYIFFCNKVLYCRFQNFSTWLTAIIRFNCRFQLIVFASYLSHFNCPSLFIVLSRF